MDIVGSIDHETAKLTTVHGDGRVDHLGGGADQTPEPPSMQVGLIPIVRASNSAFQPGLTFT